MTELIRPMLYQAYHQIENLSQSESPEVGKSQSQKSEVGSQLSQASDREYETIHYSPLTTHHYDVVGPICESTDCFRKDVELPQSYRGDLIAIRTAGAYGEVMASGYNLRDRVRSVYSE